MDVRVGTIKKAEHQRIDAFELWGWRRPFRVPWTARRSNQSILKEISPGIPLEGMMLKLKLQYFGQSCEELTHWKTLWCWEGLGARGEGDDRGWDGWMASLTQRTWVWVNSGSWWWTGRPGMLRFIGSQRVGHDWATDLIWSDEFNSDDHYIYYYGQESLGRNWVAIMVNKRVGNAVLGCNLKNGRMISVHFQGKPFNITVIQAYFPTSNAEEAEVEHFCENL